MEQIRIIKEMRKHDADTGRTGQFLRPRYMVWENVCFSGETLVTCKSGYKRIDEISIGDEVKTHSGRYMPVAKVYRTKKQNVVKVCVSGAEDIICTPNHPFLTVKKSYEFPDKKGQRTLSKPMWESAGNLDDKCMIAYKTDEQTLPDYFISSEEAWAIGRYIADGSVDLTKSTPRIFISVGNKKVDDVRNHLEKLPYKIYENHPHKSATNFVFTSQEFYNLVSNVGVGAGNKQIPDFVFHLPIWIQKEVFDGYASGDGYTRTRGQNTEFACSTASRKLAYGIARMIRNVFHVGANISVRPPKNGRINGRIIKANYPVYSVTASLSHKQGVNYYADGYVWQMVKSVELCDQPVDVWNLSVLEDNTYGANDVVVHNCGAFSSNKGKDFAAVLEETIRIAEPEAPSIEVPEKGWPTWGGYRDMDGRWSVYWRVLDAQYFGVPQRRRRIALVADFGGCTAPEILFERSGVYGHSAQSGTAGEGTSAAAENGANDTSGSGIDCKTPWETQSNRVYSSDGKWPALSARENGGQNREAVYCLQGNVIDRADTANCNGKGWKEDVNYTLNTIDRPAVCAGFKLGNSENARSIGYSDEQSHTLNAECGGNKPAVVYSFDSLASNSMKSSNPHSGCREVEVAKTLDTTIPESSKNQVPLTYAFGRSDQLTESDVACTQSARQYKSATDLAVTNMAVRRLTPLECERLQGMPDYWTDIGAWRDEKGKIHKESSDAARYKAIGNSIAIPPWKWVLKRLCAQYERDATMGSLFDGLGCFPLVWTQLNGWGSVKWASEIEPFCIAVTKRHFGDEETRERGDMWEYLTGGKKHEP